MTANNANTCRGHWLTKELADEDGAAMRQLFEAVFGSAMSEPYWQWKYLEGKGRGIGVWNKRNQLVAHYGGVPRALLDGGGLCHGVQGADAAVLPGERGYLTRRGPYFLAASTFHSNFIGLGKPYLYGFGFPSLRHYRLANILGLYEEVDRITEFSLPPLDGTHWRDCPPFDMRKLASDKMTQMALGRAWQRMRKDLRPMLVGVRDEPYLRHRYASHPSFVYQLLGIRRWPLGPRSAFAVVRQTENGELEWLDVIGARDDLPHLSEAVRRYAKGCKAPRVFGWITASQHHHFAHVGAQLHETEVVVPANRWAGSAPIEAQRGRWWLMAGDTDFH